MNEELSAAKKTKVGLCKACHKNIATRNLCFIMYISRFWRMQLRVFFLTLLSEYLLSAYEVQKLEESSCKHYDLRTGVNFN